MGIREYQRSIPNAAFSHDERIEWTWIKMTDCCPTGVISEVEQFFACLSQCNYRIRLANQLFDTATVPVTGTEDL